MSAAESLLKLLKNPKSTDEDFRKIDRMIINDIWNEAGKRTAEFIVDRLFIQLNQE